MAVTGAGPIYAGPGGGSAEKPVGLVFIGAARRGGDVRVERCLFPGDRASVREASVAQAFRMARQSAG